LADAHGDITAITGPTGGVESRQGYDPWGAQLSGPTLEMGFLGAYERRADPTTGLIQMGARSYSSDPGAFISEDPVLGHIGIGVSSNRYPYTWDNPLNRYDLSGRDVCVPTPFGDACAGDAAEDARHAAETALNAAQDVNDARGAVEQEAKEYLAQRASDFWKKTVKPAASSAWKEIYGRAECLARAVRDILKKNWNVYTLLKVPHGKRQQNPLGDPRQGHRRQSRDLPGSSLKRGRNMLTKASKRLAQIKLRFIFWTWAIALVARVTIFSSGGFGSWLCVIAFWLATAGLLAISVQYLRDSTKRDNPKYVLIIVGLVAFCCQVIALSGLVAELSAAVWIICIAGLLGIYIRSAIQHRGGVASR
jgi:RHS repeat-associated protein